MGTPDNKLSDLLDVVRSWIPRRSEPANVSRDFWMPDQSCRVCYECDSQFTVFNRRHHCRLCGLVFCAKCTTNSVPASFDESRTGREDSERIRVCNYCFRQWEQGIGALDNGTTQAPSPGLSPSASATSLASTKSSCTCYSSSGTVSSTPYSTGPYQHVPYTSCVSPRQSEQMDPLIVEQENVKSESSTNSSAAIVVNSSSNQSGFSMNRSDDEDDDYRIYTSDLDTRQYSLPNDYYGDVNIDNIDHTYGAQEVDHVRENINRRSLSCKLSENFDTQGLKKIKEHGDKIHEQYDVDECEAPLYDEEATEYEPVDFEKEGLLWIPPEPADEEDEREAILFDDDDDEGGTGEWGYLRSSNSFGSGEYRNRDKSGEEHRKALKNVVEGHFRALVAQLLQVENLPVGDENDRESWLEIITSLSWEAATLLKPDMSKCGGMDPGEYVKVKCLACGRRSESMVVKGVVCKKNVAHRRMTSKIDKPRFLILGGALEYQRVANHLSSVDTLLQQEMDHLKMAVTKIDAHHPNVLLVEKSVSRYAQEYLLAKDISLVLNIKRPLLERIARCTGAQIVPSIDHLTSQKLGYCDTFHVEKFLEEHGSAGQGGKKLSKTLMFVEGCPKPLGCTILLKGANGDNLKKAKHVVQYGVFAAYHLALETSFLADEGASLPQLPLKSPITVALPVKPSNIDRSISTIPGFMTPATGKPLSPKLNNELQKSNKGLISNSLSTTNVKSLSSFEGDNSTSHLEGPHSQNMDMQPSLSSTEATASSISLYPTKQDISNFYQKDSSPKHASKEEIKVGPKESLKFLMDDNAVSNCFGTTEPSRRVAGWSLVDGNAFASNHQATPELVSSKQDSNNNNEERGSSKEEFPPSPSDHRSILVSLSTRCVWKGSVCERPHLFRIKYYGSTDNPLGRFLRDNLFDQSYRCRSCDMPSEAHVHCYTHRQGSLTISVKKLSEILLPGEREGKIWMWHRCLRCPRTNGFPPATRRVVMSDAAWGLSFGKFLELSFSNHAAASRVANCGHSLHRDCLRFYGFGQMVACFRYASIDVNSVYLPPPKIEFNYDTQGWIKEEANEVRRRAELLFKDVRHTLQDLSKKIAVGSEDGSMKTAEARVHISELEGMQQKDEVEFEESLQQALCKEVKLGLPAIDILEINRLRRQILFHSCVWDQRLIRAASLVNSYLREGTNAFVPKLKEKPVSPVEKSVDVNAAFKPSKGFSSCGSLPLEVKPGAHCNRGISGDIHEPHRVQKESGVDQDPSYKEADQFLSSSESVSYKPEPQESGKLVRRALSDGEFPKMADLSDTLDAAWTGENHPANVIGKESGYSLPDPTLVDSSSKLNSVAASTAEQGGLEVVRSLSSVSSTKGTENMTNSRGMVGMPFSSFYSSFNKNSSLNAQKLTVSEYNPTYVMSLWDSERLSGARLFLPVGVNDTIVPVYDDEPTSVIAYTLVSSDYHVQISEFERAKDAADSAAASAIFDSVNLLSVSSFDDNTSDRDKSLGSADEAVFSTSGSRGSQVLDPLSYTKDLHARISFTDDGLLGKVKYTVTCYFAKRFDALRRMCCHSELDFIRSLSRCKKWGAQGGKSNVFFAKTLDDRFIIKQVPKTELESFIKFGPAYFKYLSESISTGSPTCLAKILGIYQVASKHFKGGKESKMDLLVMENLLFRRNITRLYDLKGSSRSRYNADTSGSNKVLLDQNLIEAMPTSPIFVGSKAKRLLERAVWNDTAFLASIDVMDYSLLVGIDEEKHELVLGIIDFMRQYTWDKHLETWVKTSGILGGPKNTSPTVISPQQYKKRFRKAMTAYFLMLPEQWTPPSIIHSGSQSDLCEESTHGGASFD